MVVTTFQHLFGIRMHHSAAPDIKKCRYSPVNIPDRILPVKLTFVIRKIMPTTTTTITSAQASGVTTTVTTTCAAPNPPAAGPAAAAQTPTILKVTPPATRQKLSSLWSKHKCGPLHNSPVVQGRSFYFTRALSLSLSNTISLLGQPG
jgi:hypothetical protein